MIMKKSEPPVSINKVLQYYQLPNESPQHPSSPNTPYSPCGQSQKQFYNKYLEKHLNMWKKIK